MFHWNLKLSQIYGAVNCVMLGFSLNCLALLFYSEPIRGLLLAIMTRLMEWSAPLSLQVSIAINCLTLLFTVTSLFVFLYGMER